MKARWVLRRNFTRLCKGERILRLLRGTHDSRRATAEVVLLGVARLWKVCAGRETLPRMLTVDSVHRWPLPRCTASLGETCEDACPPLHPPPHVRCRQQDLVRGLSRAGGAYACLAAMVASAACPHTGPANPHTAARVPCRSRRCGNHHGLIRKYHMMLCRRCFRDNAAAIGFTKASFGETRLCLRAVHHASLPAVPLDLSAAGSVPLRSVRAASIALYRVPCTFFKEGRCGT